MRKLCLKKNEDRRLRAGHLWIFANEVDVKQSPLTDFAPGEAATLCDWRGAPLGSVYVNPASLICARLHSRKPDVELDETLLAKGWNRHWPCASASTPAHGIGFATARAIFCPVWSLTATATT